MFVRDPRTSVTGWHTQSFGSASCGHVNNFDGAGSARILVCIVCLLRCLVALVDIARNADDLWACFCPICLCQIFSRVTIAGRREFRHLERRLHVPSLIDTGLSPNYNDVPLFLSHIVTTVFDRQRVAAAICVWRQDIVSRCCHSRPLPSLSNA